jgi:hypothetical protein
MNEKKKRDGNQKENGMEKTRGGKGYEIKE